MIADNFISFNVWNGININGAQTIKNTIARNSISNNFKLGIFNESGGNNELTPPLINFYGENKITGNTGPGHIVEIFVDGSDEGRFYLGMTEANLQGDFTFTLLYPMPPAPNITATSTDA